MLELTLTSRAKDAAGAAIPMCGVPFHALDVYLARLVRKGYRVAICDQVEDPRKAKGLVKREVTRVVSPGTFTDAAISTRESRRSWRPCRPARNGPPWGLAFLDVSTGQFAAAEFAGAEALTSLGAELGLLRPKELLAADGADDDAAAGRRGRRPPRSRASRPGRFEPPARARSLCEQLRTASLAGYGLDGAPAAVVRGRRDCAVSARHPARPTRARARHLAAASPPTRC